MNMYLIINILPSPDLMHLKSCLKTQLHNNKTLPVLNVLLLLYYLNNVTVYLNEPLNRPSIINC
jgi:hypothetical protein